jgi:hypothetical protein
MQGMSILTAVRIAFEMDIEAFLIAFGDICSTLAESIVNYRIIILDFK